MKPHILFNGGGPAIWHDFPVITYKKSKLYFTLLVMVMICEHVHRLELWKSCNFWIIWQRSKCDESPVYQLLLYISYFRHVAYVRKQIASLFIV